MIVRLIILLSFPLTVISQSSLTVSDNTLMVNLDSSFIIVKGDVKMNTNSSFRNRGNIYLTKHWINNSGNEAFTQNNNGAVILNGSLQNIEGASETSFYNLKLENDKKQSLQSFTIKNHLELLNCELATNNNLITLSNPNDSSLSWQNSFISSQDLSGYFIRNTNSTSTYSFPVGHSDLNNNLRVVDLTPESSSPSSFGVRLSSNSPGEEIGLSAASSAAPFSIENKANDIRTVNTSFYHNIYRFSGSSEVKSNLFFYSEDQGEDLIFRSVAKWNSNESEWQNDDFIILNTDSIITAYNTPTMQAKSINPITFEDDVYSLTGVNLIFPNSFTPNEDGFNDLFEIGYLLEEYPENSIIIYNRWGELIFKASPYLNDWNGTSNGKGVKLLGSKLPEDTYFYVLTLDQNTPPIKKYIELIID
jgi:gliding motility-associated-like protein